MTDAPARRCSCRSTSTGIPGTDLAAVDAAGLDSKLLAARGVEVLLKMILVDGFFHADPHPGNVFFLPGNRIAIDRLRDGRAARAATRREVVDLLAGLAQMEEQPMVDVLLDWAGEHAMSTRRGSPRTSTSWCSTTRACRSPDIRIGVLLRRFAGSCASTRSCCPRT